MARQITPDEYNAMKSARIEALTNGANKFQSGFIAGVEYERQRQATMLQVADKLITDLQATLDRERAERLAYNEVICGKLQGLVEGL